MKKDKSKNKEIIPDFKWITLRYELGNPTPQEIDEIGIYRVERQKETEKLWADIKRKTTKKKRK